MKPVKTSGSNFPYIGPTIDIGNAWVEWNKHGGTSTVIIDWLPSEDDLELLVGGRLLRLAIHGIEEIPSVSLGPSPFKINDIVSDKAPVIHEEGRT